MKEKTKVFVITGFLGSGKTTLVKRILHSSSDLSKTIVLVNEFGKVGIDGDLIRQTAAADVVELSSGCICCTLKTDMIQTLRMLRYDYSPRRIIIEATGVADPLAIIEALQEPLLSSQFSLEKTITVLDSDFWEAREGFGTVFASQLRHGDIILLNKIDTVDPEQIPDFLKEIREEAPKARIIPSLHCNIDPDIFWAESDNSFPDRPEPSLFQPYDPGKDAYSQGAGFEPGGAETQGFTTFSFETPDPLDEKSFTEFLRTVPLELFRIKGPVRFAGQTRMLNFVGGKTEWLDWPENPPTCLAFIGWDVAEEAILEKVKACLAR
ncbi:CobW family GTP-binding protein [Desulfospira joergensenii]|uniref:CobW family GTP-binding protein n=1 Tax=Desulfospira joergensenii TaxID=53329 RepID=UPI0003B45E63|nr:GTP-binding protein [Desulfospira joergensenii]